MTSDWGFRPDEFTHPAIQMLADRMRSCRRQFPGKLPTSMRLVVSGKNEPYVIIISATVGEWLDVRCADLPWIERSLCDAGFGDDVPPSLLRPVSRDGALASHINDRRLPGMAWPLHHAAGLFHHTLQHVELLMWPDFSFGGFADFEATTPLSDLNELEVIR